MSSLQARSLVACVRCRRLKVKCTGPNDGPCNRCKSSHSNCTFLPSKPSPLTVSQAAAAGRADTTNTEDRIDVLEERLAELENIISSSFHSMRGTIQQISTHIGLQGSDNVLVENATLSTEKNTEITNQDDSSEEQTDNDNDQEDLVSKGLLTVTECKGLLDFFAANCSESIAFFDNSMDSFENTRQCPLLLATMCTIGARASALGLYHRCFKETYYLIQKTLLGPLPSLETLKGILLMAVWHKNNRLWGLILSISYQMKLPETALNLMDRTVRQDEITVDKARTWLSFCCVDLIHNINKMYLISEIDRYVGLGRYLTSMPCRRNVDFRICAYLEVYGVANQAKKALYMTGETQEQPISPRICNLLQFYNKELETWYRRNNEGIDPIYQTFSKPQDRNRMAIPYNFMRMHINGFVLHGQKPDSLRNDPLRVQFIRAAVDAGKVLLQCALQSISYQNTLSYLIDYSGSALGLAINFLFRATCVAYDCLDLQDIIAILDQARQMFEGAKLTSWVDELRQILEQIAQIERSVSSFSGNDALIQDFAYGSADTESDIFLSARLPLSDFTLDENSIEDIFMFSGG